MQEHLEEHAKQLIAANNNAKLTLIYIGCGFNLYTSIQCKDNVRREDVHLLTMTRFQLDTSTMSIGSSNLILDQYTYSVIMLCL